MRHRGFTFGLLLFLSTAGVLGVLLDVERRADPRAGPGHARAPEASLPAADGSRTPGGARRLPVDPEPAVASLPLDGGGNDEHPLRNRSASAVVNVTSARSREPAIGVRVFLSARSQLETLEAVTDGMGRASFEGLRGGRKAVSVETGGMTIFDLERGETKTVEVTIPVGLSVRVHVTDREGLGVANAAVLLSVQPDVTFGSPVAWTDVDGWCGLTEVEPGRILWVEAEGYETSYAQPILAEGSIHVVLENPGFELCGRILDAETRAAIPGAHVRVEGYATAGSVTNPDGSTLVFLPPPAPTARASDAGGFCVHISDYAGLTLFANAAGFASRRIPLDRALLRARSVDIELDQSEGLFGFVLDEAGAAIDSPLVELTDGTGTMQLQVQGEADGSFWIPGAPLGEVVVRARSRGGYFGEASTEIVAGGRNELDVIVSNAGSVRVTATTETGRPLAGCTVVRLAEPLGAIPFLTTHYLATTGPGGDCLVHPRKLGESATIGLFLAGAARSFPFRSASWERGTERVVFRLPDPPRPATLRFDCGETDTEASRSRLSLFVRDPSSQTWLSRSPDENGVCRYEGIPAGLYHAVVIVDNVEYELGLFDLREGEERRIPLDVQACADLPRSSVILGR